jgi:hypothetical protein
MSRKAEYLLKETYKGFVLAYRTDGTCIEIYTKDEWLQGKGYRYVEHEAGTKQEAMDFIDSY